MIRNFNQGVGTFDFNNILVDNCRIENNRQAGITITGQHKLVVAKSVLQGNGRRIRRWGYEHAKSRSTQEQVSATLPD